MITILSASYSDAYTGQFSGLGTDTGSSYLIGEVGDVMWLNLNFSVSWNTLNVMMMFTQSNTITRLDQGSFINDDFKLNDTIVIQNTTSNNGTYSIISLTYNSMVVSPNITNGMESAVQIYGITPIKAVDFYYNLIQNGTQPTFKSLSDPLSIQKLSTYWGSTPHLHPTNQALNPIGASKAWWEGLTTSITQTGGTAFGSFTQSFQIIHNFEIKPWYLVGQYTNLINETPPPVYFQNANCLQHVYQIVGRYSVTDPNIEHISTNTIPLSNTGWYNEFLNGNCPTYEFTSINYHVGGVEVSALDYNRPTSVTMLLTGLVNNFNAGSKINLEFSWLPNSNGSYQNSTCLETTNNLNQLLLTDSVMLIAGSGSTNGINFGTPYQVFTDVNVSVLGSIATITFIFDFGSYVQQTFQDNAPGDTNYLLTATPQSPTVTTLLATDRTAVICDVNTATTNTDNPNLLEYLGPTLFYNYPNVGQCPTTNISLFAGDYTYASMSFCVATASNMIDFNVYVVATNASPGQTGQEYILEQWNLVTSNTFDGISNEVAVAQLRNFALPPGSIQNIRSLERDTTFDTATWSGFQMIYGFQADYRYYLQVFGVPEPFVNMPFSNWPTYNNLNGWELRFKTVIDIIDPVTGIPTQFINYSNLTANDQTDVATMSVTYQTFDLNGNNLNGNIANGMQTEIIYTFLGTGSFATIPPGYTGLQAQLFFNYQDGPTDIVYDMDDTESDPIGLWIGRPVITEIDPNTVQVAGILDLTNIDITRYRLNAKLGYLCAGATPSTTPLLQLLEGPFEVWYNEDGTYIYLESGNY